MGAARSARGRVADAGMDMTQRTAFVDNLPALDPIIAHEVTERGWRGLTEHGEILDVTGNVAIIEAAPDVLVMRNGTPIGRRALANKYQIHIDSYLQHYNCAIEKLKANRCVEALAEFDAAIALAPTVRAQFNRSLALLALGRWREGFAAHEYRLDLLMPPLCAAVHALGMRRWQGEDLAGKTLLLVHDAGFGDSIMLLRYVPMLLARGAVVQLLMPPELKTFTAPLGEHRNVADFYEARDAVDYWCPMLSLLHMLQATIATVPPPVQLEPDPVLVERWRRVIDPDRHNVGIAWSVGRDVAGDYPRAIPLDQLVGALVGMFDANAAVYSVQQQDADAARALGIKAFNFADFADCAALISLMDEIITIDTAAAHVAGAIDHPNVTVLLSHWASWRWLDNAFYPQFRICQQSSPGDWASALAQIGSPKPCR
jgi:hypothetical protein